VNLDGFIYFLNEAILEAGIFCQLASIKDDTISQGDILAYDAIFADDRLFNIASFFYFGRLSNIGIIGEVGAFCDFSIFSDDLVVLGDGVHLIVVASLEFGEAFIYVDRVGAQIAADEVHVGKVDVGGFV
jgi:hypothetical protein